MLRSLGLSLFALLAASTAALAQTPCHAEYDGPNFSDNVSMGGPGLIVAIQFVAPTSFSATSLEVFTGESSGLNTVSLWSHDAVNNRPAAQLSSGS